MGRTGFTRATCVAVIFAVTGCDMMGTGQTEQVEPVIVEPAPDASGIVTFDDFRVMVAQSGDTISSMAMRMGREPAVVARYNGLPLNYLLRPGERLAIPNDAQVAAVEDGWTPDVVTGALDALPEEPAVTATPPADPPGTQLTRHVVAPGDNVFSIAKRYGVSVTALVSWNALDRDLTVTPGRSLIIPPKETIAQETSPIESAPISQPGSGTTLPPPPSATVPLPEDEPAQAEPVERPDIALESEPVVSARFQQPVSGKLVKGYSQAAGPGRNDGIDYQTAAAAEVRAAGPGEVALVSRSLGGLGTILLIRHGDDLMTVYGRITDITVDKGDSVRQGQIIGKVAPGTPPIFHFEVRRGMESIDPTPFLR